MADVRMNKAQWESISKDEQEEIVGKIREAGLLGAEDGIVGDDSVAVASTEPRIASAGGNECEQGCQTAYAAATLACSFLPGNQKAICNAAASLAFQICTEAC